MDRNTDRRDTDERSPGVVGLRSMIGPRPLVQRCVSADRGVQGR